MHAWVGPAEDHLTQEDIDLDKERAAAFWMVTLALFWVLLIAHPPTVALGVVAGWAYAALSTCATLVYVARLRAEGAAAGERSIFVAAIVGVVNIAICQWLSGGFEAPQQFLFTLTVLGTAAVLPPRMLVAYLVVVTAVTVAPFAYDGEDQADVAGTLVLVATVWLEGLLVVQFSERLRAQRHALYGKEREAVEQARSDALTGLGNRRALEAALGAALASGMPFTLIYLDLNGFKSYNDRFGHAAGDALLVRLGTALASAVSAGDRAFRLGGDEFCALLEGVAEAPRTRRVVDALSEGGAGFAISASSGVVVLPDDAVDADAALRLGDERMYADKRGGRASPAEEMSRLLMRVTAEREPELYRHTTDVVGIAERVAARMGCDGEELENVVRAAEQHDIGKVAVPDAILRKPGPLDDAEWELMRQHTTTGERILATVPALHAVGRLVRSSHERWDGGGYPDGLAGEAIPLGARIVSACDAYSAMRSDRPYSPASAEPEALAELRACSGTQFDPAVVSALLLELTAKDPVAQVALR